MQVGSEVEVGARDNMRGLMTTSCMIKGFSLSHPLSPLLALQATPYGLQPLAPAPSTLATTRCVWGGARCI